jgi:hypothetical protein
VIDPAQLQADLLSLARGEHAVDDLQDFDVQPVLRERFPFQALRSCLKEAIMQQRISSSLTIRTGLLVMLLYGSFAFLGFGR